MKPSAHSTQHLAFAWLLLLLALPAFASTRAWGQGSHGYNYKTETAWAGRLATLAHTWSHGTAPTESAEYDGLGHLTRHTVGAVSDAWDYDGLGALSRFTSADAPARTFAYGVDGRLASASFGLEVTHYGYTSRGDVAAVQTPDGRLTQTQYEYSIGHGRALPARVTVGSGGDVFSVASSWDAFGHLASRTEAPDAADSSTTQFVYGPRGNLKRVTLPTQEEWNYSHDKLLRLTGVTPPAGAAQRPQAFMHDGLGRVTQHDVGTSHWGTIHSNGHAVTTTPLGEYIDALVDGRGRIASVQYNPSAAPTSGMGVTGKQYAFDGWNALVALQDTYATASGLPPATSSWEYNTSHLLASVRRGADLPTNYTYDSGTRRRATRGPLSWSYDALGRLSQVEGPWGVTEIAWEAGGQRLTQLGDESFSYDGRGWLAAIASPGGDRIYTYDGRGNRLSEAHAGRLRRFAVDKSNRLTAVQEWDGHIEAWQLKSDGAKGEGKHFAAGTTWPVSFGATGHFVHRQFNYKPDIGALESIVDVSTGTDFLRYVVDANGQVTSRTFDNRTVSFRWDVDGRLVEATQQPAPGLASFVAAYQYDGLGMRRRAQVTQTPPTGPSVVTARTWTWAGNDGEEEVDEDGKLTVSVGPYRVGEGTTKFTHDALGSVTTQSDGLNFGFVDFSAWGQRTVTGTLTSSAGHAGGKAESVTGLDYNRRRWKDPVAGIFISRDEIGASNYLSSPNGINPWDYAAANPLRFTDPDGRDVGQTDNIHRQYAAIEAAEAAQRTWLPPRHESWMANMSGSTPYSAFLSCMVESGNSPWSCRERLQERAGYEREAESLIRRPTELRGRVDDALSNMSFTPNGLETMDFVRGLSGHLARLGAPQQELETLNAFGEMRANEQNAWWATNVTLMVIEPLAAGAGARSAAARELTTLGRYEVLVARQSDFAAIKHAEFGGAEMYASANQQRSVEQLFLPIFRDNDGQLQSLTRSNKGSGPVRWTNIKAKKIVGTHGNNLTTPGPHDVYVVRATGPQQVPGVGSVEAGQVLHFGETGRGWEVRGREWARTLEADYGFTTYSERLTTVEGKAAAKTLETRYIKTYERIFSKKPGFFDVNGQWINIQKTNH